MSSSFIHQLIGDVGCSVDSSASNNPLVSMTASLLDGGVGVSETSQYNNQISHVVPVEVESANRHGFDVDHHETLQRNNFQDMHYSTIHANEMDALWSQSQNCVDSTYDQQPQFNAAYATSHSMLFHNGFMPTLRYHGNEVSWSANVVQHQPSSSSSSAITLTDTATANSTVTATSTTNHDVTKYDSIDEILKDSLATGQISTEELQKIHKIIGYNPNTSKELIETEMAPSNEGVQHAWEKLSTQLENLDNLRNSIQFTIPSENPYLSSTVEYPGTIYNDDTLTLIAQKLFQEGNIQQAVLASEANVQKNPENSEAWRMLGTCYAENEQDKKALFCLKKSVELDPYNLEAQLALGTSYVNELNSVGALNALRSWITHNPAFSDLEITKDAYSDGSLIDDVTQLMLTVLKFHPSDPQAHTVMGVLYNVSMDYASAIQHFKKALEVTPDDYALLNKLGATLANNKECAEATQYYAQALQLRPSYVRGWVNLGIAYFNMGDNVYLPEVIAEAARAFIQALSLAPNAPHVWSYLRLAMVQSSGDRLDLMELTAKEDLAAVRELAREMGVEMIAQS